MTQDIKTQVQNIISEYRKESEELRRQVNCFDMLRFKYTNEVHLHSAFIANLLDIDGAHNMGDIFLKAFLRIVLPNENYLNIETAQTFTEYQVYEGENNVGNIDILIKSQCKAIIIENKTDTKASPGQLEKYKKFGNNHCRKGHKLLYLTFEGEEPPTMENPVEIHCISYKEHILEWIKRCIELTQLSPSVNIMIRQYHEVVNTMLGQSREVIALKQIKNLGVTTNDLFNEYFFQNLDKRLKSTAYQLEKGKLGNHNNHLEREFSFYIVPQGQEYPKMTFQFREKDAKDLVYGIEPKVENTKYKECLMANFRWNNRKLKTENQKDWITSDHFDKYRNWGAKEYMMMTDPNSKLYDYIIMLVKELFYAAEYNPSI